MSENPKVSPANALQNTERERERGKLSLATSLIVLIFLYLATGTVVLFVTSRYPTLVNWLEAGQWLIVLLWIIVGVRPPVMRWWRER